jgi:transketolase
VWLIDRNRIQAIGGTEEVLALEPLDAKLDAFGFRVISADGHDFASLLAARDQCSHALVDRASQARPLALILNTIKGHGIRHMQDTVASHFLPMDDAQYSQALDELAIAHAAAVAGGRDAG